MYALHTLDSGHFISGQAISGTSTTLTGNGTFTMNTGLVHKVDPGGSARNYDPSGTFPPWSIVILINAADAAETITFDSEGLNQAVARYERGIFVFDGTDWLAIYVG